MLVATFLMVVAFAAQAQAPYRHGIGVTAGTLDAASYKTFFSDHLALQADLGYKYILTAGENNVRNFAVQSIELNPNIMYEKDITKGFYLFGGGGISLGYSWIYDLTWSAYTKYNFGKFGINAIAGGEYKFEKIPLALQIDFRPGYGLLFTKQPAWNYFDWSVCASARYTF